MSHRMWRVRVAAHEVEGWPRPDRPPNRYAVQAVDMTIGDETAAGAAKRILVYAHVVSETPRLRSMLRQSVPHVTVTPSIGREDHVRR